MLTITNEDNMEMMARYQDNHFDLLIADPPYGIDGNSHRKNKSRGKLTISKDYHSALWDQSKPNDEYFKEATRISKNQIFWGGNYFDQLCTSHKTPRRNELQEWLLQFPKGWIVWDKCNGSTSYNDFEMAWTSFDFDSMVFKFMWNGMMQGLSMNNGHVMNGFKKNNEVRIHPTQKPVPLYQFLVSQFVNDGDKLVDTHLGGGSIALVCTDMKIDLTACEIDKKYFDDAVKRINNHMAQLQIF